MLLQKVHRDDEVIPDSLFYIKRDCFATLAMTTYTRSIRRK